MNINTAWHEDVEQYCILSIGSESAIAAAFYQAQDWVAYEDLWHAKGHSDELRLKKSAYNSLSNAERNTMETYLNGFVDGYDQCMEYKC